MTTKKPPHIERLHCNSCRNSTKHLLLKTHIDSGFDEEQGFSWQTKSEMFECRGCSSVLLRQTHHFSEDPDPQVTFFPPPASRWLPQWQWSLPHKIMGLLAQVYRALQADSLSLAMMGARAVLDTAIIDTVTDHGNFGKNLQAMKDKGYLSEKNCEYLEVAFDAGSASVHRSHNPDQDQVNTVMDIVENMLQSLFVLEKKAKALKGTIPPRPKAAVAKAVKTAPPPAKP
jgi:hypothetical protein